MSGAANIMALRLQAEAGDPRAQVILAHALLLGDTIPSAPADALRLLNAACEKDYPDALLLRASLSILGFATPRNYEEGFRLLARAAAKGDARAKGQMNVLADADGRFNIDVWRAPSEAKQHFTAPRIFTLRNFISKAACAWLIERSQNKMEAAATWDDAAGAARVGGYRSSSTTTLRLLALDIVSHLVNLRIAGATGTSLLNQEPTSILHYAVGQEYKPHFDFISGDNMDQQHADELKLMGQRVSTLLIYLNEGYEGGETDFPRLNWRFKGEVGDALFFCNLSASAALELKSLHAGLPVTRGDKWLLSKWIRAEQVPLWWPRPEKR